MQVEKFAEGVCDECGRSRKGVRFFHGAERAFLCWEHFRLAVPALREPAPAVIRETIVRCDCSRRCGCHCSCSRSHWSYGCGRSVTESWSETTSEGISRGESRGISEGRTQSES